MRLRNFIPVDIITTAVKSLEAGSRPLELEGQLPVINTVHVEPSGDADLKWKQATGGVSTQPRQPENTHHLAGVIHACKG